MISDSAFPVSAASASPASASATANKSGHGRQIALFRLLIKLLLHLLSLLQLLLQLLHLLLLKNSHRLLPQNLRFGGRRRVLRHFRRAGQCGGGRGDVAAESGSSDDTLGRKQQPF